MHPVLGAGGGRERRRHYRRDVGQVVWLAVVVRERRTVEEVVLFEQIDSGLAQLVERGAVAAWFFAGQRSRDGDEVFEDFALLCGC